MSITAIVSAIILACWIKCTFAQAVKSQIVLIIYTMDKIAARILSLKLAYYQHQVYNVSHMYASAFSKPLSTYYLKTKEKRKNMCTQIFKGIADLKSFSSFAYFPHVIQCRITFFFFSGTYNEKFRRVFPMLILQ